MSTNNESQQNKGITFKSEDPNQDKSSDKHDVDQPDFVFDEKALYHPVFFLTEVPDEYRSKMADAADENTLWVDITSKSPTNVIQEIKANTAATLDVRPMPFADSTVDQVYDFFKNHLRPADDDPRGCAHTFTYFTFLVVDTECLNSDPWQCILCCDAPDYGEGPEEVKLKQLRMPIARAMEGLVLLELLVQTPSEFERKAAWVMGMIPPGWDVEIHNERGDRMGYTESAPPGQARRKKRRSIEDVEETARQRQAETESVKRGEL